jgi:hypothetical protein
MTPKHPNRPTSDARRNEQVERALPIAQAFRSVFGAINRLKLDVDSFLREEFKFGRGRCHEIGRRIDVGNHQPIHPEYSACSVCLDICCFDDRPRLLDLGTLQRAEPFRRLRCARRKFLGEIGEAPLHSRVSQRLDHRRIEARNHIRWRAFPKDRGLFYGPLSGREMN